jgi:hypothetical protein
MKPYKANFINALLLILLGCWGYFGSNTPSVTALIPVFAGIVLLILTPFFKNGNRLAAHVAVGLTFLLLIALFKPLTGAIERSSFSSVTRVCIMIASTLFALVIFIKSFVEARRNKA